MRLNIFQLFIFLPFFSIAQTQNSRPDTSQINQVIRDVQVLVSTNRDSALRLNREAYKQSVAIGHKQGIADAGWLLGTYEMHMSRHEEATRHYQKSIEIYKELQQPDNLLDVYVLQGINEAMQNYSAKALSWFFKAIGMAEKLNDSRKIADLNYKIGLVYGQVNDWKNAIRYCERSLNYAKAADDKSMMVIVYNNLGVLYGQMKEYDKALAALEAARDLETKGNTRRVLPDIYQNMGSVYRELGKYDLARVHLDSAIVLQKEAQYPKGIAGASTGMADLLIRQRKYDEAFRHLSLSMQLSNEAGDQNAQHENTILLHKIYTGQGKYKEAALLFDTIMKLQDAVEIADERAHVEQTGIAVEMQKAQGAIREMEAEKDVKTWQRNLFIIATILTLILVIGTTALLLQIRKKNKQMMVQQGELAAAIDVKDKMFAVISHDLRSPLNSIIGSLELLESDFLDEKERKSLINNLHLSASATLETLDNLLQWGSNQFRDGIARQEAVDVNMLAEQTRKLLANVAAHKSVSLVQKIDDVCIARFDKAQLAFIVRNLMVNAIKFSHEGQKVELHGRKENDRIILQVKDHGVGMSREIQTRLFRMDDRVSEQGTAGERGVGLGLVLINEFLQKNNGSIQVSSQEGVGSCFEVDIPAV